MNTLNSQNKQPVRGSAFAVALIVVIAFAGLFLYQQKRAAQPNDHRLHVVTTILPVYVFTQNVAGNLADVSNLVPPGTELHNYAMSPSDQAAIIEADVVVKNGYGLDDFVDAVVAVNARPGHTPVIIDAGELVDGARPGLGTDSPEATYAPDSAKIESNKHANPHIWVNPAYAVHMVEGIRNGLMKADPKNAGAYAVNAEGYLQRLLNLDARFHAAAKSFKNPTFIAEEQSMSYLAQEYGLTQAGILALTPDASLSPRDIAKTEKLMKDNNIKVIFKNASSASTTTDTIAKDTGAKVYSFDAFEMGDSSPAAYEQVMDKNIETLKTAFK